LAFEDEKDAGRRRKSDHAQTNDTSEVSKSGRRRSGAPEVGSALRSVYQRTVNEDIPPEMLDLLGKLG
jgi:hypothetical protein